ncbi:MAG: PAS domain-containing protein, partial [Euryarchaeota archaeon]|nr:PAS domain-containing protein [Euryarchaeota archaeon]
MDSIALGWSGLTCFVLLFGFALLYLYRKDHDTHKLMFALGILPGALTFSINALDSLKISIPDVLSNRMIDWGCVPLSICVFFILFSQIFFKKKDFKIIFRTFLFFFIISFIIFVSGMVTDTMFSISIPIGTLAIIVFSFVLLIRDRNISSILFILAMICFTLGGITLREFRESPSTGTVFGPLFCYFMSYILLILIVRTALSNVETKGIETYFTLKNKLKTAETTLETTEKRYQMIVENSVDTVMLTQPDGIISYVSPSCESVLGYKPEELIGQRPNIVHPDDSDLVQKIFSQA